MKCKTHPSFLEVYYDGPWTDGAPAEIGILCSKCGTKTKVWPKQPTQYYCRFCGHHSLTGDRGCAKCGSSVPLKGA